MIKYQVKAIKYRAQGAKNGIEILIVGAFGLLFIMLVNLLRPGEISVVEIFLVSLSIAAIVIGYFKTQEPFYSIILSEAQLIYQHKYGAWHLAHKNFLRSGIPKIAAGLEYKELNAVGIKVNDMDEFLSTIAPRIAGKLLIEQRHLFMQAVKKHCADGDCPSNWLVEDSDYKSEKGICYNGLIAMFANRALHLKQLTGYDLLLPASELECDIWGFSTNLNNWKCNPNQFIASQLKG